MSYGVIILAAAVAVGLATTAALSFGPLTHSRFWRATVTPLASIIGSGFLICGPLLAREFGSAAILAEAMLLLIAYAMGAVMRFNIIHVENHLAGARFHDPIAWAARASQVVLSLSYAVSVAYYLKLFAAFGLRPFHLEATGHELIANLVVTGVILILAAVAWFADLEHVEHLAHATVSLKLGVIAGLLTALGAHIVLHGAGRPPPMRLNLASVPVLLGLLITVQGFETTRYTGHAYDAATRIRAMAVAQWISSAIYLAFLALLTPFLAEAARSPDVAGILDIMGRVAPFLGVFVLLGAVASQISAAVADSIGAAGLMSEVSRRRLKVRPAFLAAAALSVLVVWLTDPFQVIALASRAFAVFYALQCAIAVWVSLRTGAGGVWARLGMGLVGLICVAAALAGAPAES